MSQFSRVATSHPQSRQRICQRKVNSLIVTSLAVTHRPDFPGAAVVHRTVISYDEPSKRRTSRQSKRKTSDNSDDYDVNNSVHVKSTNARVMVGGGSTVKISQPTSVHSHNASTVMATERPKASRTTVTVKQVESKREQLDNLLEELDAEDSHQNFKMPSPVKATAIKVVNNPAPYRELEEDDMPMHPQGNYGHQDMLNLEKSSDGMDHDNYNYNPNNGIMQFDDDDDEYNFDNQGGYNDFKMPSPQKPSPSRCLDVYSELNVIYSEIS